MSDNSSTKTDGPNRKARVFPPDYSLKSKLGGLDLEKLWSPEIIREVQQLIADSSDQFLVETLEELAKLKETVRHFNYASEEPTQLGPVIGYAFAIKSKSGLGGYDLIATIAKSLQGRCEQWNNARLTPPQLELINWHVQSLEQLTALRIKGSGGEGGKAILAELTRLSGDLASKKD